MLNRITQPVPSLLGHIGIAIPWVEKDAICYNVFSRWDESGEGRFPGTENSMLGWYSSRQGTDLC